MIRFAERGSVAIAAGAATTRNWKLETRNWKLETGHSLLAGRAPGILSVSEVAEVPWRLPLEVAGETSA